MNITDKTFQGRMDDLGGLPHGRRMPYESAHQQVTAEMLDEIHQMLRELTGRGPRENDRTALQRTSKPNEH